MNTLYDWHCTIICTYYDCVLLSCCVNMLFTPVNTAAPIRCSPANSINLSQCPNENSNDDCSCRLFDAVDKSTVTIISTCLNYLIWQSLELYKQPLFPYSPVDD